MRMPRVSSRSLCATGRPCSGPKISLCACISSAFAAASAAISGITVTMALTFEFTRSICLRCAASASRADSFLVRISRAISTVLKKQTEEAVASASRAPSRRSTAAIPSRTSRRVGLFSLTAGSLPRSGVSVPVVSVGHAPRSRTAPCARCGKQLWMVGSQPGVTARIGSNGANRVCWDYFRLARDSDTIVGVITQNTPLLSYEPPLDMENPTRDNICRNCRFDRNPFHLWSSRKGI